MALDASGRARDSLRTRMDAGAYSDTTRNCEGPRGAPSTDVLSHPKSLPIGSPLCMHTLPTHVCAPDPLCKRGRVISLKPVPAREKEWYIPPRRRKCPNQCVSKTRAHARACGAGAGGQNRSQATGAYAADLRNVQVSPCGSLPSRHLPPSCMFVIPPLATAERASNARTGAYKARNEQQTSERTDQVRTSCRSARKWLRQPVSTSCGRDEVRSGRETSLSALRARRRRAAQTAPILCMPAKTGVGQACLLARKVSVIPQDKAVADAYSCLSSSQTGPTESRPRATSA